MKFLLATLLVALFAASGLASELLGLFADPANPGKCVYDDLILSPGEEGDIKGECSLLLCSNELGLGKIQGCGIESVEEPCTMGDFIDSSAPYPDCCKQEIICPKSVSDSDDGDELGSPDDDFDIYANDDVDSDNGFANE
ncbi:uncharacterized protein LOC106092198 [Stomoxys calcitrans]|uniref:Single domain-containing protein n=1 Tax=Stomoxys calcitrans TaxID=35570 RepID=A0A1I8Q7H3_STOCA|nr:uncharacterized protein LOC106092198 [Stomoxys calcitrans]